MRREDCSLSNDALEALTYTGCSLSLVCLLLTVASTISSRKRRENPFHRLLLQVAVVLVVIMACLIAGLEGADNKHACQALGLLVHVSVLLLFALMMVIGIYLYVHIVSVLCTNNIVVTSNVIAFVTSAATVIIAGSSSDMDAYGSKRFCWMKKDGSFYGTFVTSLLIMLVFNITIMAVILRHLRRKRKLAEAPEEVSQEACLLYKMMILTGVIGATWVSGVLVVLGDQVAFRMVFVILNSLSGITVFVLYIFNSPDVQIEVCAAFRARASAKKLLSSFKVRFNTSTGTATASTSWNNPAFDTFSNSGETGDRSGVSAEVNNPPEVSMTHDDGLP